MIHPFADTRLPIHLAKRLATNRGGEAMEKDGHLEIRRGGRLLGTAIITDDTVKFLDLCGAFAQQ